MISKAKIKYIRSLDQKKFRRQENAFVAEGPKVVGDLLAVYTPLLICALPEWLNDNISKIPQGTEICELTPEELQKISFLQHPQQVLAIFAIPEPLEDILSPLGEMSQSDREGPLCLALDGVQDPGNLGTIIRIADWFGITDIYCSKDTADCYNPKVVQATMGSLARVAIHYVDLVKYLSSLPQGTPIYGTFLDGDDITTLKPSEPLKPSETSYIVMGNEGNGISKEIEQLVTQKLLIPKYSLSLGEGRGEADSLNVAIATAITCFHFRNIHKP